MVLLNGQSLVPVMRFDPETFQLTLGEKDSTAQLTVGPEVPEIGIGSWLQDDTDPGRGIVWRVKSISTEYKTETRTITLEHIIQILRDTVVSGTIGSAESSMSAVDAARAVLALQGVWTLGAFEYALSAPYEFSGDTVFDALETICGTLADSRWEYDLTALPFKLHVLQPAAAVESELRAGRNMNTISRSVDRSKMYTRIYPIGANDMRLSGGGYIEQNAGRYGLVCKVETNQGCTSQEQLRLWAEDRLRRHCEPTVSISVTGLDLSRETGEPLDALTIGRLCRVPMPELGAVITEKITRIQWKDKRKAPEDVTVTLANNAPDVATIFKTESAGTEKSVRRGAKIGGKNQKENADNLGACYKHITDTAEEWSVKLGNTETNLSAQIKVQADRIGLVVQGEGPNARINPANITAAINDGSSEVYISADHIKFSGAVSMNSVFSVTSSSICALKTMWFGTVGGTETPIISSSGITTPRIGLMTRGQGVILTAADVSGMVTSAEKKTVGGIDTLILKTKDRKTINFTNATTLSGAWSGRVFTVNASPQNKSITTTIGGNIGRGDISWGSNHYTGTATLYATISGQTGQKVVGTVTIDAYDAYQAGASSGTSYTMTKATDRSERPYHGPIYDANGNWLGGTNYWFGCSTNLGGTATSISVRY